MDNVNLKVVITNVDSIENLKISETSGKFKGSVEFNKEITSITSEVLKQSPEIKKSFENKEIRELDYISDQEGNITIQIQTKDGKTATIDNAKLQNRIVNLIHKQATTQLTPEKKGVAPSPPPFQSLSTTKESEKSSYGQQLLDKMTKVFTFESNFRQPVGELIGQTVKGMTKNQMIELYTKPSQLFQQIEKKISQSSGYSSFTREEMVDLVNATLIEAIKNELKIQKKADWSEDDFNKLDMIRFVNDFTAGFIPSDTFEKKMLTTRELNIPLKELSNIPITTKNKKMLALIWSRTLTNLFVKGNLSKVLEEDKDLAGTISQLKHLSSYYEARSILPKSLEKDLSDVIQDLEGQRKLDDIKKFIVERGTGKAGKAIVNTLVSDQDLKDERRIYSEHLYPTMQKEIDDLLINNSLANITHALFSKSKRERIVKEILTAAHPNAADRMLANKFNLLDSKRIEELLINELEYLAVDQGFFTSKQIENLRHHRELKSTADEWGINLHDDLSNYKNKIKEMKVDMDNEIHASVDDDSVKRKELTIKYLESMNVEVRGVLLPILYNRDKIAEDAANYYIDQGSDSVLDSMYDKLEQISALEQNITHENDLKKVLEILRQAPTEKVQSLSLTIGELSPIDISLLESRKGELITQMKDLRLTNKQEGRAELLRELAEINKVFAPLREISKLQKGLDHLNKANEIKKAEIKNEWDIKIKVETDTFSEQFKSSLSKKYKLSDLNVDSYPINELANITPEQIKKSDLKAYVFLWKTTFEYIFNESKLADIDSKAPLDESMKTRLIPYVKAKNTYQIADLPDALRVALDKELATLEMTLPNVAARQYINEEKNLSYQADCIFNEGVYDEIRQSHHSHPLLNPEQQIGLMKLSKSLIPVQKKLKPKHKEAIRKLIDEQKVISLTPAEVANIKKMIDTEIPQYTSAEEKKKLQEILDKSTQIDLRLLSKIIPLLTNSSELKNSEETKKILGDMVKKTAKDPEFKKGLKILIGEYESSNPDKYLQRLPSFSHSVANKYLGEPDKFDAFADLKIPLGITSSPLQMVYHFSSKIPKLEEYEKVISKSEKLWDKVAKNESITAEDKLSLKEMAALSNLLRGEVGREKVKDAFIRSDLADVDPDFAKLKDLFIRGEAVFESIDKKMRSNLLNSYHNGAVLAYSGKKKSEWLGSLKGEEYLTSLISDYSLTHGAKLYKGKLEGEKDEKLIVSHVVGNWYREEISNYQLLISDVWELDVTPLINPEMEKVLKSVYGDAWKDTIRNKYEEIESTIHSSIDKHYTKIQNSSKRRIESGMADYPTIVNLFNPTKIEGHKVENIQDFNEIHKKFFEGKDLEDVQICSEFASQSTAAAMIEMNRFLTQDILTKYYGFNNMDQFKARIRSLVEKKGETLPNDVKDYLSGIRHYGKEAQITVDAEKKISEILKLRGIKENESQLFIRLGNQEIFDLPYDKKERMNAIHPGRMVTLLENKHCVKKKDLLPEVALFIKA